MDALNEKGRHDKERRRLGWGNEPEKGLHDFYA